MALSKWLATALVPHATEEEETSYRAAAAYARALFEVFECDQRVENHIIFPLLVGEPSVSLAAVMSGHTHAHRR